mgnify:FL=1
MISERQRNGVYASALVHQHLTALPTRIPHGTRARPVRSRDTVVAAATAIKLAIAARWGVFEGGAVEVLDQLRLAGFLPLLRTPCQLTAGMALSMLARLSPLVEVVRRGLYRIHAVKPAAIPDHILRTLANESFDDASGPADSENSASHPSGNDASVSPPPPCSLTAVRASSSSSRAGSSPSTGPACASGDEQLRLAFDSPGAAATSSSTPAEAADPRPRRTPARAPLEGVGPLTEKAWRRAVPLRPQLQRAAQLALDHLTAKGVRGTATTIAFWLAGHEDRASWRTRSSLARALKSLERRGLLLTDGDLWRVVPFAVEPILDLFDRWIGARPRVARRIAHVEAHA